ncbi:MAG: TonB-dependent receptor, partial [Methylotenera sp.]|nr:TonB-dependent receptor [Methylotenera sp.]
MGSVEGVAEKRLRGIATNGDDCQGVQGRLRTYDTYGVEPRLTVTHAWGELQLGAKAHFEEQNRIQINGITPTARTGTTSEKNKRETDAYSGFISNRFDIGQFSITPAVRYEHIKNERTNLITKGVVVNTEGETSLSEWIPGIGFAYNPNVNLTVFAGVHRGFAPPRTEDLINDTAGGVVDVDAERSTNYELGFRAKPVKGLNVESTAFYNDFSNLIAVGSVASNVNLSQGEATFAGLELSGQYDFDNGFYGSLAYTWLPVAEQDAPFKQVSNNAIVAGSAKGNRQPYAPKNTLAATLGYKVGSWNAQLEAVHVGKQYADFSETETPTADGQKGEIASYTIYNAALNYKYEPYKTTFFVTGKNLLDKDYITDRTRGILTGMPRLVQV